MIGLMKKTFVDRSVELWKNLYTKYIRPHAEYAVPVWNPYLKQDILKLEKVQERATKIPYAMRQYTYPERCEMLGLTTLETRRGRGNMIQRQKIETGLDDVRWHDPPKPCQRSGRLNREIVRACEPRHNFFINSSANDYNNLPIEVVSAPSINAFKKRLDDHMVQSNGKTQSQRRGIAAVVNTAVNTIQLG
jgi:hypothetical protein